MIGFEDRAIHLGFISRMRISNDDWYVEPSEGKNIALFPEDRLDRGVRQKGCLYELSF
jgi:hypothetical protein